MTGGPVLHAQVASLAFLVGRWAGEGTGGYPTIEPFSYREETEFSHTGKPFLSYSQRTWDIASGQALHSEVGYWRAGSGAHVEAVIVHPTGVAEVEEGEVEGGRLVLASRFVGITTTAKEVTTLSRTIMVEGDIMAYTLVLGAVGQHLQQHLSAQLRRV